MSASAGGRALTRAWQTSGGLWRARWPASAVASVSSSPASGSIHTAQPMPASSIGGAGKRMPEGRVACGDRSEEHTSELQSLMRISYAVFCLKKKNKDKLMHNHTHYIIKNIILSNTNND